MRPLRAPLLAGLLPFAVLSAELHFAMQTLCRDKSAYYYSPGTLLAVAALALVATAQVAVLATHAQLRTAADPASPSSWWWWRSFAGAAASAAYVLLYCAWYFFARLHVEGAASAVLYFGYCALACAAFALLAGSVGFLATHAFVARVYR
jgi:transmembrane 9 superfamily protein 2/4